MPGTTNFFESDVSRLRCRYPNAPPPRDLRTHALDMARTDNDGYRVEDAAVDGLLAWQPLQRIALALDFVPMEGPVDHRDVYSGFTLAETEFFHDSGVMVPGESGLQFLHEGDTNVTISHSLG